MIICTHDGPGFQRVDNAIHQINYYPVASEVLTKKCYAIYWKVTYPVQIITEQLGPG